MTTWNVSTRRRFWKRGRYALHVVPKTGGFIALLARIFDADALLTIMQRAAHITRWADRQAAQIRETLVEFETADC